MIERSVCLSVLFVIKLTAYFTHLLQIKNRFQSWNKLHLHLHLNLALSWSNLNVICR